MAEDMMGAIKKALLVIVGAIATVGVTYLILMVYGLMIGAFSYQAENGNIGVDTNTVAELKNATADYWDDVALITGSIGTVIGFLALVLLFMIFKPFIGKGKSGDSKVDF